MNIYELELLKIECDPVKIQKDFAQSYMEFYLKLPTGWVKPKHFDFELLSSTNLDVPVFKKATLKGFNIFMFSKLKTDKALNFFRSKGFSEPRRILNFGEVPIKEKTQNLIVGFMNKVVWDGVIIFCAHDGFPLYVLAED